MMKNLTVKLKIDGVEVEIEEGRMILEAARRVGIRIPTLCHDRRLVPFGACRLCVVEQKGRSGFQLACFTPVREGMEIITRSPEISESRRLQLQLILLNHPMVCPHCDKEGECALQSLVYEYGVEETRYPWERISFPKDHLSSLLRRDDDKCILCGRCVRICDEVQGIGELSFTERGIKSSIDTDFHRPLNCEFCGQCLDTCPVGAITSDCFDYSVKAWELRETTAPCPYCACGCLLTLGSKDGEVKRVFSDPASGPSDGNLCVKGRFGWDFIDHPERIGSPLLKVNGTFKEASWDEALRFVSGRLEATGPAAVAAMASSRLTNEEYHLFGRLFRKAIGTDQIFHAGNGICKGLTEGLAMTLGIGASTNSIQEVREADCILVIGADPSATHPIIKNEIHLAIRQTKAQLIVLGSYDIGLSRATQVSPLSPPAILLLQKPGMEVSLLNAMVEAILKEGLENKDFIEKKTEGLEELKRSVLSRETSHEAEGGVRLNGAQEETVRKAARAFAQAKKAMILVGSGLGSHLSPREVAIASSNLALITGQIGRKSSGILLLLEKANSQGAIDSGIFPDGNGQGVEDLSQKVLEGKVKALYVVGEDPLAASSDPGRLREAFKHLQLLVVQDLFMTETAKMADVVLPACAFAEKSGTYTNLERRVQKLNPMRPPLNGSKSDFEIFLQLLRLLEYPIPAETEDAVFEELRRTLPHYEGVRDGEQWPIGSPYLYSNGFPVGRARLVPVKGRGPLPASEGYPFQLIQRPSLFRSGFLSSKSEALNWVREEPHLEINPGDGERLKIADGDLVRISTPDGRSLGLKLKYALKLSSGVVTALSPCPLVGEGGISSVKIETLTKGTLK